MTSRIGGARRITRRATSQWLLIGMLAIGLAPLGPVGCAGRSPGVIHHVRSGENLYRIGLRYGVEPKRIAKANGIRDVRELRVGQRLFIPGGSRRGSSGVAVAPKTRPKTARSSPSTAQLAAREQARRNARSQKELGFRWPVRGRMSSGFGRRGGRPHEGIDIAARKGTPIVASDAGRVIHSGWMRGYGKVVIIKHAGAYRTVYAHASRLHVRKGEFVERGQKIAEVGSTGRSSGPHLHFEIRRGQTPQNPMRHLR